MTEKNFAGRIEMDPIAYVSNCRYDLSDDYWGGLISKIRLVPRISADALRGIEEFSHLDIVFHFHRCDSSTEFYGSRRPRNNPDWPEVGILAQRAKNRVNRLGLTTVKLLKVSDRELTVSVLDAVDGTPVLDIKPVIREFLPCSEVHQPLWLSELMRDYWRTPTSSDGE
ncbi:MAG: SAM-dependent methyltransferase [Candidatus Zixiibacteriota bacterium]